MALVLSGCTTTTTSGHGSATSLTARAATSSSSSAGTATTSHPTPSPTPTVAPQPPYVPPADGSGYSNAPVDQPQPLPYFLASNACRWLPQLVVRLKKMGATGTAKSESGCDVTFPGHENVEVTVAGPYTLIDQETTYLKPTKIAGLQARYYSFVKRTTDTICAAEVNTRSLEGFSVDDYNDSHAKGSFAAHCSRAGKVAAIVAKMFVPLAGGHAWSGAPQQPSATTLNGMRACGVVDVGSVIYAHNLADNHPRSGRTARGTTCDYKSNDSGVVHVLLTTSRRGLGAVPTTPHATVLHAKLGVMPARTEQIDIACTVAAQLITGQVVEVTYTLAPGLTGYPDLTTSTCQATTAILSSALMGAMQGQ